MSVYVGCEEQRVAAGPIPRDRRASASNISWLIGVVLSAASRHIARWRDRRRTVNELSRLDDHLLRDIGVDPSKLPASVSAGDLRNIAILLTPLQAHRRMP